MQLKQSTALEEKRFDIRSLSQALRNLWLLLVVFINTKTGEGGEKRRGLGPRNDVLITCKAVTLRGGQCIIAVFFPQSIF